MSKKYTADILDSTIENGYGRINLGQWGVGIGSITNPRADIETSSDAILKNGVWINNNSSVYFADTVNNYGTSYAYIWGNGNAGTSFLAFDTNAGRAMTIDNSRNVGIGTTSPGSKLEVAGDINITGGVNNRNIYINHSNFDFRATTTSGWAFGLRSYTNDGSALMSYVAGAYGTGPLSTDFQYNFYGGTAYNNAAMYIPASKNVGIGTTSPIAKLDVNGNVRMSNYLSATGNATYMGAIGFNREAWTGNLYNGNYGAYQLHNYQGSLQLQVYNNLGTQLGAHVFNNDGSVTLYGNVGIGTTIPVSKTHVYQNDATTGTDCGLTIEQDGTGDAKLQFLLTSVYRWVFGIDNSDGDKFKIGRGSNWSIGADINIDTSGNIGIGTNSPAAKLHVNGDIYIPSGSTLMSEFGSLAGFDSGTFDFKLAGDSIISNPPLGYIKLGYNSQVYIDMINDYVGIGTTTPASRLDVNGTITATNSIDRYSNSTTNWTTICYFSGPAWAYTVLLATGENGYSQTWRVSGSVNRQTCVADTQGDNGHTHSKDATFRCILEGGQYKLQYKNVSYTTGRSLFLYEAFISQGYTIAY